MAWHSRNYIINLMKIVLVERKIDLAKSVTTCSFRLYLLLSLLDALGAAAHLHYKNNKIFCIAYAQSTYNVIHIVKCTQVPFSPSSLFSLSAEFISFVSFYIGIS